jgi:hypothetical protein
MEMLPGTAGRLLGGLAMFAGSSKRIFSLLTCATLAA